MPYEDYPTTAQQHFEMSAIVAVSSEARGDKFIALNIDSGAGAC
jgi:hypothetical protein